MKSTSKFKNPEHNNLTSMGHYWKYLYTTEPNCIVFYVHGPPFSLYSSIFISEILDKNVLIIAWGPVAVWNVGYLLPLEERTLSTTFWDSKDLTDFHKKSQRFFRAQKISLIFVQDSLVLSGSKELQFSFVTRAYSGLLRQKTFTY